MGATERGQTARARWRTDVQRSDPAQLVFVDECGKHTPMTHRTARAPRGIRARGKVPGNPGPVTTLIAGSSLAGMSPAMTVQGGTTAAVFAAYLEQVLLPALRPGQVMVDDVGARARPDACPDRGRRLPAGPPAGLLSGPLSGRGSSRIRTLVETAGACTRAALDAAIAVALAAVTASDAAGWFTHTGPTVSASSS